MFGSHAQPAKTQRPAATARLQAERLDDRINPDALAINDVYTGFAGQVLSVNAPNGVLANDLSPNNASPNLSATTVVGQGLRYIGDVPVAGTQFPPLPANLLTLQPNGAFTVSIPSNTTIPDGVTGLQFNYKALDQNQPAAGTSTGLVTINLVRTGQAAKLFAVGSGVGVPSQVRVFDAATGNERFTLFPYETTFTGGVRVTTGDVGSGGLTGAPDGIDDVIVIPETGSGGGPRVRVFDGRDGVPIADFFAFNDDPNFRGGGDVAVGNVDGSGNSIIVGAGDSGGPRIQVFRGQDVVAQPAVIAPIANFFAYEPSFRNGVRVSAGNVRGFNTNDSLGRDFIVTGSGVGGGPRVSVFDFATLRAARTATPTPVSSFFAFDQSNRGGVNVAVGKFRSDGRSDILVGEGQGGSTYRIFDGSTLALLRERQVSGTDNPTGITPSPVIGNQGVGSTTNFGQTTIGTGSLVVVGTGGGTGGTASGGVRVAVADRNADGLSDVVTALGNGSIPRVRVFDGNSLVEIDNFLAFSNSFNGGVFVGGNSLQP